MDIIYFWTILFMFWGIIFLVLMLVAFEHRNIVKRYIIYVIMLIVLVTLIRNSRDEKLNFILDN